jgi:hypothetical protein
MIKICDYLSGLGPANSPGKVHNKRSAVTAVGDSRIRCSSRLGRNGVVERLVQAC